MNNIFQRIDKCIDRQPTANVILLGYNERQAYKASHEMLFHKKATVNGDGYYKGLRVLPVDLNEYFAVGIV